MLLLDDTSPSAVAAQRSSSEERGIARGCDHARLAEARGEGDRRGASDRRRGARRRGRGRGDPRIGALTDAVLDGVLDARARVALLPCCHDEETCDAGGLRGWFNLATAVDATRVARLRANRYSVLTQTIPRAITAKNRLLLGAPLRAVRDQEPPDIDPDLKHRCGVLTVGGLALRSWGHRKNGSMSRIGPSFPNRVAGEDSERHDEVEGGIERLEGQPARKADVDRGRDVGGDRERSLKTDRLRNADGHGEMKP